MSMDQGGTPEHMEESTLHTGLRLMRGAGAPSLDIMTLSHDPSAALNADILILNHDHSAAPAPAHMHAIIKGGVKVLDAGVTKHLPELSVVHPVLRETPPLLIRLPKRQCHASILLCQPRVLKQEEDSCLEVEVAGVFACLVV
ncbi:UNVERIFIED_CONTAM: hypothetical protein FKN15_049793 [Acipenser sinensis]